MQIGENDRAVRLGLDVHFVQLRVGLPLVCRSAGFFQIRLERGEFAFRGDGHDPSAHHTARKATPTRRASMSKLPKWKSRSRQAALNIPQLLRTRRRIVTPNRSDRMTRLSRIDWIKNSLWLSSCRSCPSCYPVLLMPELREFFVPSCLRGYSPSPAGSLNDRSTSSFTSVDDGVVAPQPAHHLRQNHAAALQAVAADAPRVVHVVALLGERTRAAGRSAGTSPTRGCTAAAPLAAVVVARRPAGRRGSASSRSRGRGRHTRGRRGCS